MRIKEKVITNSWSEWKKEILAHQDRENIFIFGSLYTLRDEKNKLVSPKQIAIWLKENSLVPDLTIAAHHIAEGFLMTISTPGFVHGYEAFGKAAQVIFRRTNT